jgi:hypothetical protein
MPAKTVMIILPPGVVVSAQGSEIDLNLTPASINDSVVSRSVLVDRAQKLRAADISVNSYFDSGASPRGASGAPADLLLLPLLNRYFHGAMKCNRFSCRNSFNALREFYAGGTVECVKNLFFFRHPV